MLNRNNTNSLLPPVILFVVFAVFTFMVTLMDVKPVGPYDSGVGLGTLNKSIADTIGVHMIWYHITNILGILALLIAAFFAAVGVLQLVTRKSLARVDSLMALAFPVLRMDMLARVMPTLSASSVTDIFRFASMTSILMMIFPSIACS